jgi:hypothetical protein
MMPTYALYAPGSSSFYALVSSVSIIVPLFFLALFMLYRNRHRLPFVKYKRRINLDEENRYPSSILEASLASSNLQVKVDHDTVDLKLEDLLDINYSVFDSSNNNDEEKGIFDIPLERSITMDDKEEAVNRNSIGLDDNLKNHTSTLKLKGRRRRKDKT